MGHKASECRGPVINEMYQEEVDKDCGSVEVGRVWNVCQVETKSPYDVLSPEKDGEGEDWEGHGGQGHGGDSMPLKEDWMKIERRPSKRNRLTKRGNIKSLCDCGSACKEGEV